jgi:hypothetical protein
LTDIRPKTAFFTQSTSKTRQIGSFLDVFKKMTNTCMNLSLKKLIFAGDVEEILRIYVISALNTAKKEHNILFRLALPRDVGCLPSNIFFLSWHGFLIS